MPSALCNSSQWVNSTDAYDEDGGAVAAAHIIASTLSASCCLVVLGVSAKFEKLRRFPNNMLLWRTACDLLTSTVLLATNLAILMLPQDTIMERGHAICGNGIFAGLIGFSLLASPGCLYTTCLSLYTTCLSLYTTCLSLYTTCLSLYTTCLSFLYTTCLSLYTTCLSLYTTCLSLYTTCLSLYTTCLSLYTTCLSLYTTCLSLYTTCLSLYTTCLSLYTTCLSLYTTCLSLYTTCLSLYTTCLSLYTTCLSLYTTCLSLYTTCLSLYTTCLSLYTTCLSLYTTCLSFLYTTCLSLYTACLSLYTTCLSFYTTCLSLYTTCLSFLYTTCLSLYTACLSLYTTCLGLYTTCLSLHTTCLSLHTTCLSFFYTTCLTLCLSLYTTCLGVFTTCLSLYTTCLSLYTTCLSLYTTCLSLYTTCLSLYTTCLSLYTTCLGVCTTCLSLYTTCLSLYTTCLSLYTTCLGVCTTCLSLYTTCLSLYTTCLSLYTTCLSLYTTCLSCYTTCLSLYTTCLSLYTTLYTTCLSFCAALPQLVHQLVYHSASACTPHLFCALAVNLNRSLHDPFTKPQSRMGKFHYWIWGSSLSAGICAAVLHEFRPNLHMCWTCQGMSGAFSWLLLFAWLVAYWAIAAVIMLDAWYWLIHARRKTDRLSSRKTQLRSSVLHVATIGTQWILTGTSFALIFEPYENWSHPKGLPSLTPYRICFALSLGLLGVADLISWLATSLPILRELRLLSRLRELLKQSDMEQLETETCDSRFSLSDHAEFHPDEPDASLPAWFGGHMLETSRNQKIQSKNQKKKREELGDISDALRREFVQFTITGIAHSADRAQHAAAKLEETTSRGHGAEVELAERSEDRRAALSDRASNELLPREVARRLFASLKDSMVGRDTSAAAGSSEMAVETLGLPFEAQLPSDAFTEFFEIELAPSVYFRDLAPLVFEKMRTKIFGVSREQYISSIWGDSPTDHQASSANVVNEMVLSFSEGKGGGFFFWSLDRRFMVKTLEPSEFTGLKALLPRYFRHLWSRRNSLLSRFYGAYSITIHGHTKQFVVMESVFHAAPEGKVHERYDLKGSWVDRHSDLPDASSGTYKDLDLKKPFQLPYHRAEALLDELKHDSALLHSAGLMDYSLLVGVHNHSVPEWNISKRMERIAKIIFKGRWGKNVRAGMSAIDPTAYRTRFLAGVGYQLGLTNASNSGGGGKLISRGI
ncbi:hypothetical protein AB1Y20_023742 [Prymnesium parvum]|uniref:PIPK domain-containing protein n=1 Tax=Prymnesium parvum TaxID=97485 RepID=A0AB34JEK4_PRYPA